MKRTLLLTLFSFSKECDVVCKYISGCFNNYFSQKTELNEKSVYNSVKPKFKIIYD